MRRLWAEVLREAALQRPPERAQRPAPVQVPALRLCVRDRRDVPFPHEARSQDEPCPVRSQGQGVGAYCRSERGS